FPAICLRCLGSTLSPAFFLTLTRHGEWPRARSQEHGPVVDHYRLSSRESPLGAGQRRRPAPACRGMRARYVGGVRGGVTVRPVSKTAPGAGKWPPEGRPRSAW